jgi:FlaA1/EpsC-like NDP-sugar epimerase
MGTAEANPWELLMDTAPIRAGIPFLCLIGGGVYQCVWARARTTDFVRLAFWTMLGTVLAIWADGLAASTPHTCPMPVKLLYVCLSVLLLVASRAAPRFLSDAAIVVGHRYHPDRNRWGRALVYGAGPGGLLLLREEGQRVLLEGRRWLILGLLDEDTNLHGRRVFGHKVLGGAAQADAILRKRRVDAIVVTQTLPAPILAELRRAAAAYKVALLDWHTTLMTLYSPKEPDQPATEA